MKKTTEYILLIMLLLTFVLYKNSYALMDLPLNFRVWGTFNPDTDAESEKKLFPEHFRYVPYDTNKRTDALQPYQKNDFIIFTANYLKKIYPDTVPLEDEIGNEISVNASLGEYEPFAFAVHAIRDLDVIKIEVEDLKNIKNTFPHQNIDIRVVKHLYKKIPRKIIKKQQADIDYTLFPVLLEKRSSVTIKKNKTRQFWGTVFIPATSAPGIYKGKITLYLSSGKKAFVTLNLRIYPFDLMTPDITYGLFYSLAKDEPNYPENLKKEFIDMREHGINAAGFMSVPPFTKKNDKVIFDFSLDMGGEDVGLKQLVDAYLEIGFTKPVNYTFMTNRLVKNPRKEWARLELYSDEFDSLYRQLVNAILNKRKEGWPVFYFGIDEPSGKKKEPGKYYLKLLKDIPGVVTIAELNGLTYGFNDTVYFAPYIEIECFNRKIKDISYAINRTTQHKKSLCVYNPATMGREPFPERYSFGFDVWRLGSKGVWQWNYHQGSDLSWKDKSGKWHGSKKNGIKRTYMAFAYGYPSPDGPIPSIAWEALREGIDDAKYIYTLKKLIEQAKLSNDPKALKEADSAQVLLDKIFKELPLENQDREKYLQSIRLDRLDELRRMIADRIVVLKGILNK